MRSKKILYLLNFVKKFLELTRSKLAHPWLGYQEMILICVQKISQIYQKFQIHPNLIIIT